ncbi:MAG: transcriptional regulator [Spirochaetes bacterium GWB1_48_6]|nr:MAG: transcriptional regulator [Spirochaetes bacterium GWB1_48_6]
MDFLSAQASDDFNKARAREMISRIINLLRPQTNKLLSLSEIKSLIRPKGERYRGMQSVPVSQIVGSEGRYRDFNKAFLPRFEYMRQRWESVDKAHLQDIILPPIKLYQVGDVYFVRDGNNRVSVAMAQGVGAIDAEVVELTSEFPVRPGMDREEITKELLKYERQRFILQTHLDTVIPMTDLEFTSPGRYDEVINHIMVHKYYINQGRPGEISFQDSAISWFNHIFKPIMDSISLDGIIARFPGRTKADLYMWISQHWDSLKHKYGEKVSMSDAVKDFSNRFGKSLWEQFLGLFKR